MACSCNWVFMAKIGYGKVTDEVIGTLLLFVENSLNFPSNTSHHFLLQNTAQVFVSVC